MHGWSMTNAQIHTQTMCLGSTERPSGNRNGHHGVRRYIKLIKHKCQQEKSMNNIFYYHRLMYISKYVQMWDVS